MPFSLHIVPQNSWGKFARGVLQVIVLIANKNGKCNHLQNNFKCKTRSLQLSHDSSTGLARDQTHNPLQGSWMLHQLSQSLNQQGGQFGVTTERNVCHVGVPNKSLPHAVRKELSKPPREAVCSAISSQCVGKSW